jgi:hypothetical protein
MAEPTPLDSNVQDCFRLCFSLGLGESGESCADRCEPTKGPLTLDPPNTNHDSFYLFDNRGALEQSFLTILNPVAIGGYWGSRFLLTEFKRLWITIPATLLMLSAPLLYSWYIRKTDSQEGIISTSKRVAEDALATVGTHLAGLIVSYGMIKALSKVEQINPMFPQAFAGLVTTFSVSYLLLDWVSASPDSNS